VLAVLGLGSVAAIQHAGLPQPQPRVDALGRLASDRTAIGEVDRPGSRSTLEAVIAMPESWHVHVDTAPLSITTTMALAEQVAEGRVVAVHPGRFNTSTGAPPASGGPTDSGDADDEWSIHRLVVLDVDRWYRGDASSTHLVLVALGGGYDADGDGNPEFQETVSGLDLTDVAIGDRYLVYGIYPWTVPPDDAVGEPWEGRALELAARLTATGQPALFVEEYAAYRIAGSRARSATHHADVPAVRLRGITEGLAGR